MPTDHQGSARSLAGALVMAAFCAFALFRWWERGNLFYLLLFLRDVLAAVYFLRRTAPRRQETGLFEALAFVSSSMPFFYMRTWNPIAGAASGLIASLLAIAGFLIATLALIDLGTAFGFSPAVRSDRVTTGLYRYTRHPMYCGYVISEAGWILLNPLNALIFSASAALYWIRALREERIFQEDRGRRFMTALQ